jgi:hypothetical protein
LAAIHITLFVLSALAFFDSWVTQRVSMPDDAPHEANDASSELMIEPIDLKTRRKASAAWMPQLCGHTLVAAD